MMTEGQGVSVAVDASWCEVPAPVEGLGVSVAVDASWEEMLSLADCPVSQGGLADNGSDAVAPPVVCIMQGTVQGLLDVLDLVPLGFSESRMSDASDLEVLDPHLQQAQQMMMMMMMMMMVFKCVHDEVVCYCSRSRSKLYLVLSEVSFGCSGSAADKCFRRRDLGNHLGRAARRSVAFTYCGGTASWAVPGRSSHQ
jgi:hypothetical protein